MVDVGVGQLATATGRYRPKKVRDAMRDNHPFYAALEDSGGIFRIGGGRTIMSESLSGQNTTVDWVGENGSVSINDVKVLDSPEFTWRYQLGSVTWSLAEQYQNMGEEREVDLVGSKYDALEGSMMNEFHEGMLSSGTGSGGLQLVGAAALVSTTPTTGTVGTIDRSSANAAWFRNQKFDTSGDWADGAVDAGNVKRFLDKGIDSTMKYSKPQVNIGLLGQTHFEFANQAIQAIQVINDKNSVGHAGYSKLVYRGVPLYHGGGVNYSGATAMTATRTYLLNTKPGGVNLYFHRKAEFALLSPVNSDDQAAVTRLMFNMTAMTVGGLAKLCWVGFD